MDNTDIWDGVPEYWGWSDCWEPKPEDYEIWKVYYDGPRGLCEASSHGRVRKNGIVWEPGLSKNTYKQIYSNGKVRKLHIIIAELFIPNPDNKPCVLHWDDNPLNNHVSNLRWGTNKENTQDMFRNGYTESEKSKIKRAETQTIKEYGIYKGVPYSKKELSELFNVSSKTLNRWKYGHHKSPYDIVFPLDTYRKR